MTEIKFKNNNYNFIDTLNLFLIGLYPVAIITGNFFINFFTFLISLNFFFNIRNNFYYLKQKAFYIFIFFFFTLIINLIFSVNFENTAPRIIKFFFIIFFIFEFQRIRQKFNNTYFENIYKFWFILFIITSLDIIFEIIVGQNLLGFKANLTGRVASFFGDELVVGAFYHGFVLIFLSYLVNNKSNKYILLLSILSVILISFLIGERSNFIKSFISVLVFFLLITKIDYKIKISMIVLLIISILSIINFNIDYKNRYLNQFMPTHGASPALRPSGSLFSINGYFDFMKKSQHGAHRISAYQIFRDNIYTGVGIKNFRDVVADKKYENNEYLLTKYRHGTHPHQIHYEFLSETGIIGYVSFLIFILFSLSLAIKSYLKSKNLYQLSGIIFVITSLFPIIPSGSFFSTLGGGIFWLNFAIMIGFNKNIKF